MKIWRKILEQVRIYLLKPRYHLNRFQFQLLAIFFLSFGFFFGMFVVASDIIPKIFAVTSWTQTDWSEGSGSSTTNQYSAISNTDATGTVGQVTLAKAENFSHTGVDSSGDLDSWLGINPTSISGLQEFVKADVGVYTDSGSTAATSGQDVQQWNDQSGNSNNATAPSSTRRPTLNDNQINGRPALSFTPDNDTAGNSDALDAAISSISSLSDVTYFAVGSFDYTNQPSTNYDYLFSVYNSASPSTTAVGSIARQASNGAQPDHYYTYYNATAYYGPTITSGFKLYTQQFNNTSPRHYVWFNRSAQTVDTISSQSTISNPKLTLGKWQNGTWALNGKIAEFLMYNASLSSTDRQAVENYLNNKYNLGTSTLTIDSGIYRTGTGSAKVVTGSNTDEILQNVNVGDTNTYNLVAYAYIDGSTAVDSNYAELYSNGSTVSTTYTSVGSGWYKLSGTVTGASASRTYGVQVKANKTVYLDDFSLAKYQTSGTITSNIYDTGQLSAWGSLTYTSSGSTVSVKVRAGNVADLSDATAFASCSAVSSGSDLTGGCTPDGKRYVQYQVTLSTADVSTTPTFSDITINYSPYDTTAPPTNASSILMYTASGGRSIASNGWNNSTTPYFSWTAGADDVGGSGLLGYCLYLGTDSDGDPATSKGGVLGTTPVSIPSGSTCQFIVSSTSVDLSTSGYIGTALVSGTTYYLNIVVIDNGGNTYTGGSATFHFRYDSTAPTNLAYLTMPSQNFSNVADMNFSWPTSGGSASSDSDAGVLGWQYQINSSSGTWQGTTHDTTLNLDYIPATASAYTLVSSRDSGSVAVGNNVIYFRTVDSSGNTSSSSTYRTGNLTYGGAAPSFTTSCSSTTGVTLDPTTATSNSFALSWETASPSAGQSITHYYYMINTSPPSTLSTITSNTSTYIDNGTSTSVSAGALTGSIRGSNTVYVVVADDADNYSSSNCLKGTYTLNSTNPDPPTNVSASDASVKSASLWRASLAWGVPSYKGTGDLTYTIDRSTDDSTWTNVATTSGTAYVDTVSNSSLYYWRIGSYDTSSQSESDPSYATSVSLTPTGKYTTAADLSSGPTVSDITTKKAKITWSTSRASDSKVSYGLSSGSYYTEEPSNSTQTTDHAINLTNLTPGTTYYFKAKWTDGDGNTGTSSEKIFSTSAAPTVKDVSASSIGLDSAILKFTSVSASSVKIYYGTSTSFGSTKTIDTSTSETTYTAQLTDLKDGTKYYYKINTLDSDGDEYEGTVLDFTTLPKPKISTVRIQEVTGTAQPTVLVTWTTNTEISSIATYYPSGKSNQSHDQVNVALVKGEHKMLISSLFPQTLYNLVIKGVDKAGNEAISDVQTFTTATDTRPPAVSNLHVEGGNTNPGDSNQNPTTQLIVSWDTDEPATSQVQFGEGTGSNYSSQTQEDSSLTSNHIVVISGLTPSKVYHLQALSKDKAVNQGKSMDTVTITPKATDNALNLVISNLQSVFGFLGGGK